MIQILKNLVTRFSRQSAAVEADERHTAVDKHISDDDNTQPVLRTPKESSYVVVESRGFDPYNSGSFETSKSRESRSRE